MLWITTRNAGILTREMLGYWGYIKWVGIPSGELTKQWKILKMAIEIVDFPINSMVIFHCYVSSPEDILRNAGKMLEDICPYIFQWVVWLTSLSHNDIDAFFSVWTLNTQAIGGSSRRQKVTANVHQFFHVAMIRHEMKPLWFTFLMTKMIMVHSDPFGPDLYLFMTWPTPFFYPFWTVRWLRNPAPPNGW